MKSMVVICCLWFLAGLMADPVYYPRGCFYIMGNCVEECPEGTHSYSLGCSPMTPEATCDEPNPVETEYTMCDFSACYCNPPTVRDTETNKCVSLKDCPKKSFS